MIQMKNTGQGGAEELGQEDKLGSCMLYAVNGHTRLPNVSEE